MRDDIPDPLLERLEAPDFSGPATRRRRCLDCGAALGDEPTQRCDPCAYRHDLRSGILTDPDDEDDWDGDEEDDPPQTGAMWLSDITSLETIFLDRSFHDTQG